jgi:hypothetical protein
MSSTEVTTELEDTDDAPIAVARPHKLREKFRRLGEKAAEPEHQTEDMVPDVDAEPAADSSDPAKRGTSREGKAFSELREEDNKSVVEWLKGFAASGAPIKVQVKRREPKYVIDQQTGQRITTAGLLETFDREITEEEVQQQFGGGIYQVIVMVRNKKGKFEYEAARQFEVAGEPVLTNLPGRVPTKEPTIIHAPEAKTDPLAIKAFDMLTEQVRNNQRQQSHGPTQADQIALMNTMLEPMRQQNASLLATIAALQTDLREARKGDPTETSFSSRMMDKLIDQDTARLTAQRTQFESEIRTLKENAREDEKRLRDAFERDKQYLHNQHEREVASIRTGYDQQIAVLNASHALSVKILENENRRLEKDNTKLDTEVSALRNKKDPSLKDKIDEINAFKDLVGGDDEGKSTVARVIEGVANSPLGAGLAGLAERALSGAPAQQAQAQAHVVQPQQPSARVAKLRLIRDKRTDQVYDQHGRTLTRVNQQPAQPQVNLETGEVTPPVTPPAPIPYIDPEQVRLATMFMLNGYQNGTEPLTFAESARPHVSKEILGALQTMMLDDFLTKVAQLDGTSPLRTQAGRNWLRKVVKHLLGETE